MKVYNIIDHLKKCPADFLRGSKLLVKNGLHTEALIADAYRKVSGDYLAANFDIPREKALKNYTEDHLIAIHISCWLLHHDYFQGGRERLTGIHQFLFKELETLSEYVKYQKWLEDDDRTEELVRLALKCCKLIPEGETTAEAEDRFDALSTIKRHGVLEKSKEAFERMMEIRRKMEKKKAREAANPYGRE